MNNAITINNNDYKIMSLKDRQQSCHRDEHAMSMGISSASWSFFGVVWPSSHVLANTVSVIDLEGLRVLEIGCGIGLASIVLSKMGANVTASDYHPLAQTFLDRNMQINKLPPIKFQTANWETENPLLGEFDLIIGSDVLYEPAQAADVSGFIDTHSSNNVEVIIVDPNRGNRAAFTRNMLALGYQHHFESFNIGGPANTNCKGRILHYQRVA
jgi:predicted nicotinamide N-methyase